MPNTKVKNSKVSGSISQCIAIIFAVLLCFLFVFSATGTAKANVNQRIFTILIEKNPITRHLYFVPTYPGCIAGPTLIRVEDQTNSPAYIFTGQFVRIAPYSSSVLVEYVSGFQRFAHWTLVEKSIYGGPAFLYFRSCFARLGPPMPIFPMQPIPQNPIQFGPPPIPSQTQTTDPVVPQPPVTLQQRIGAICNDNTQSQAIGPGACSFHHGVNHWIYQ